MAKFLMALFIGIASFISGSAMTLKAQNLQAQLRRPTLFPADNLTAFGSEFTETNTSQRHLILGIGFPKCGSHHTWEVFSRHPDTVTGYEKELKYFESPKFAPGSFCRAPSDEFPYEPQKLTEADIYVKACYGPRGLDVTKKLLEFSPGYAALRDKAQQQTVDRLADVWRDTSVRMIALVRDPVQRATSEINMFRDYGTTNGTDQELSDMLRQQLWDDYNSGRGYHITAGEYAEGLKFWLDHFPKENILVVNNGALNEVATWKRMFKHTGLTVPSDEWLQSVISSVATNGRTGKATYMKLSQLAETQLRAHFASHDQDLWNLLGLGGAEGAEPEPWW